MGEENLSPAMLGEIERLREQLAAEKRRVERARKEVQWLRDLAAEGHQYGSLPESLAIADGRKEAAVMIEAALADESEAQQ